MRLRVLSLNAWGLPGPFSRDLGQRTEAIAGRLADFDADLIAFQEIWTEELRDALVAAGRMARYGAVWQPVSSRRGGGLLVLSRLPIREARFQAFELNGLPQRFHHSDYYSGKGFVLLQLEADGLRFHFLDTHLHANYEGGPADEYRGHRSAQVIEIAAALSELTTPVVAVGDFNLREHDEEYRLLVGLTGLDDAGVALERRFATVSADNPYRGGGHRPGERIDYVLARDGRRHALHFRSLERVMDEPLRFDDRPAAFSDHAALLADLEFLPRAEAEAVSAHPQALSLAERLLQQGRESALRRQREERLFSAGAAGASLAGLSLARRSRRRILRGALIGASGLGLLAAAGLLGLSEIFVPGELRGFDAVARRLRRLEGAAPDRLR